MPDCLLTAPPRPGLRHVENPAIPVHFVRNPRDDNPVKSASRYRLAPPADLVALEQLVLNLKLSTSRGSCLARAQNSAFNLAFDNGASKSNSLSVGCGWPSNISNKCYHASSNRRVGG